MKKAPTSHLAQQLRMLSIGRFAEEIREKIGKKTRFFNLTIGDFAPQYFGIPQQLTTAICHSYRKKNTNYPQIGGMPELRTAISKHLKYYGQFNYSSENIVVASGARSLIYLTYKTIVDHGEKIIYTVPSWNNQNFAQLAAAQAIPIQTSSSNNFLPTVKDLQLHLKKAVLLVLNSPLNPSGTEFTAKNLRAIMQTVVIENKRRHKLQQKPLYVVCDIIYWLLLHNPTIPHPLAHMPVIKDYVIFIDGISKCFAATGVRVGWAFGPKIIIDKIRLMLAHVGAWTPKPEQLGVARYLHNHTSITKYLGKFKQQLQARLDIFYSAICELKNANYPIDVIKPHGGIYVSLKLDFLGAYTAKKKKLATVDDILWYLVEEAKVALVPFYFFGASPTLPWFRLSIGTCSINNAKQAASALKIALSKLQY